MTRKPEKQRQGKGQRKKPRLEKESIKDLDVPRNADGNEVKGGSVSRVRNIPGPGTGSCIGSI